MISPVSYRAAEEPGGEPASGIAGKAKAAAEKTAVVVATGLMLAGGLVAWLWANKSDDDDETIIEQHHREQNELRWKRVWQDNPTINPAMTAAYKDDHK